MRSIKILTITLLIFSFASLEWILRSKYGFRSAILFEADLDYEYIPIPQETIRFGAYSYYNKHSQRNREIMLRDSLIILGFGDSVLNGGVTMQQDSLATTLATNYLTNSINKSALFTNISAGSWGPDNAFAYLKKHGNFGADMIFLQVSSHDAFDNMDHKPIVDKHVSYPSKQYSLAIWELTDRYLIPRARKIMGAKNSNDYDDLRINKYKEGASFNSGFEAFKTYCDSLNIPLVIYLHAEKQERLGNIYNEDGTRIIDFCTANNIKLIKELDYPFPLDGYRDKIHLSEAGQRYMFNILTKSVLNDLENPNR